MEVYVGLGLAPLILTIASFALPLISLVVGDRKWFYHVYGLVFGVVALVYALISYNMVVALGKPIIYPFGGWPGPIGIVYEVDGLGAILGLLVAFDMLLVILYSWWYMWERDGVEWYYTLLLLLETGMLGIVYTGDIFNLFVMIELLAIAAYGLVAFHRSKKEAVEAAVKYSVIGATATTMYFLAIVFIYGTYGTVNMADLALKARPWLCLHDVDSCRYLELVSGTGYGNTLIATSIAMALALWAFTFKAAVFPNHFWLPDAHPEAPTPVSAALSGLVVKMGAYATLRFVYTLFGVNSTLDMVVSGISLRDAILVVLLILGAISAILGALVMVIQDDIKRLLAYSTIAHLGIVFMGIGVGLSSVDVGIASIAITGVVLHIINHSFGKTLLFMASGVYIDAVDSRSINDMRGLGKLLPFTTFALILGLLHLLGIPPLGGFFSKLLIYNALMNSGLVVFAIILVLSTAISILGYMKVIVSLIVPARPTELIGRVKEHPLPVAVLFVIALIIVMLGIWSLSGGIDYLSSLLNSVVSIDGAREYINSMTELSSRLAGLG